MLEWVGKAARHATVLIARPTSVSSLVMARDTLGKRIERLRKLTELSARDLDFLAGLHSNHVRAIETGQIADISGRTLLAIAGVLGVSLDFLYAGDGKSPSPRAVRRAVAHAQRVALRKTGT